MVSVPEVVPAMSVAPQVNVPQFVVRVEGHLANLAVLPFAGHGQKLLGQSTLHGLQALFRI